MPYKFYKKINRKVQCTLCPHHCQIHEGKDGICGTRGNVGGRIVNKHYGRVSAIALDPIEKKPFYHYYPGSKVLSIGGIGCNLKCTYCQNWEISQSCNLDRTEITTVDTIINQALNSETTIGIAYTYNEPTIWFEFMADVANRAKSEGLKNVMVSNGYVNQEALEESFSFIDAYSIDLKAFSHSFYREIAKADLQPVLDTLKSIRFFGKHLEITYLVIPGKNDDEEQFQEAVHWIKEELGENTILHLSRYFPKYKMSIAPTPINRLIALQNIAKQQLNYVYVGNVGQPGITNCHNCNTPLVTRQGFQVTLHEHLNKNYCINCNTKLDFTWH